MDGLVRVRSCRDRRPVRLPVRWRTGSEAAPVVGREVVPPGVGLATGAPCSQRARGQSGSTPQPEPTCVPRSSGGGRQHRLCRQGGNDSPSPLWQAERWVERNDRKTMSCARHRHQRSISCQFGSLRLFFSRGAPSPNVGFPPGTPVADLLPLTRQGSHLGPSSSPATAPGRGSCPRGIGTGRRNVRGGVRGVRTQGAETAS